MPGYERKETSATKNWHVNKAMDQDQDLAVEESHSKKLGVLIPTDHGPFRYARAIKSNEDACFRKVMSGCGKTILKRLL